MIGTNVQPHSNWLQNFQMPKHFCTCTMMVLNSEDKSSITSSVQKEMIAAVSTLVVVHATYPTYHESNPFWLFWMRLCESNVSCNSFYIFHTSIYNHIIMSLAIENATLLNIIWRYMQVFDQIIRFSSSVFSMIAHI